MHQITQERSFHRHEPFGENESCFDSNVYYHGICAWQDATEGYKQRYKGFELSPEEFDRRCRAMRDKHCNPELLETAVRVIFQVSYPMGIVFQEVPYALRADVCLSAASYAQSKVFGTKATEGDLDTYFFCHPELDILASAERIEKWRAGNSVPLLSFLYERIAEATEAYQDVLKKYGGYPLDRVTYAGLLREFVPLYDVLDTDYFLLHALIELVEPKVGKC